ncbi:MAG: triose-phosphate isomerase [Candidatus Omnitrophica bacterium]|nr:triose-phosphate isomerase [Candidatus Omnitrophota bacterium]
MPSSRIPIIAGNWKMYKTIPEAVSLAAGIKDTLKNPRGVEVIICPPYTSLSETNKLLAGSGIHLGAQDLHWEKEGAFTGEISAGMLKDAGCRYVIIGHSERRTYFGETDETVNKKLKSALFYGLIPIVCVGETLSEREDKKTFDVIKRQVENGLAGLPAEKINNIVVAYEPVWAIGTGRTATPEQAQEAHAYIRKLLSIIVGENVASMIRIQYGGSVKPDNISEIMKGHDIDGALVGGASLKTDSFVQIVRNAVG